MQKIQLKNIQPKQKQQQKTRESVSSVRWKTNQVIFHRRNPKSRGGLTMASKTMTITTMMMSSEYGPYLLLVVPARRIHRLYNVDGVGDEQSVKRSTCHHA